MITIRCILLWGLLSTGLAACRQAVATPNPAFFACFHPLPSSDTLHVEVYDETDSLASGDTISNALFFKTIPPALLQAIDYLVDSSQSIFLARQSFPLTTNTTAYWVEIRLSWFQHHSLFLYDNKKGAFTDRITLAEWFGGDGGQVLTGSWLFDFDGDGKKDIVLRVIQHSMIPNGEEVEERTAESATLYLWKNGRFVETAQKDSLGMVKRFPIRSFWE